MREEAFKRIGHLYPPLEVTAEMAEDPSNPRPDLKPYVGKKLKVIAWIWARTVKSPNPAFAHVDVPLASSFLLSTKEGKETYIEPVVSDNSYRFSVRLGRPTNAAATNNGTKLSRGANFSCVMSGTPITGDYIRAEAMAGRMSARLMAVVAEGKRRRVYLDPLTAHEMLATQAAPPWKPEGMILNDARAFTPVIYGLTEWHNLFTNRQLVAMDALSLLAAEASDQVRLDAIAAGMTDDCKSLTESGSGATAYAEAVSVYLGLGVARYSNASTTLCSWNPGQKKEDIRFTFSRQALSMTWDFAEGNPFSESSGNYADNFETWIYKVISLLPTNNPAGSAMQSNAATQSISSDKVISTDPPYYDNVPYSDLSDFFYVWQRRALKRIYPELYATLAVPKAEELVAAPYRHGGKVHAEAFFLQGMTKAMHRLVEQAHESFPVSIYYAFKQSETDTESSTASTGWETFLDAAMRAGFAITGTWPVRTERDGRTRDVGSNALASSIVLVCRKRDPDAPSISRRDFQRELRDEMPEALETMIGGKLGVSPIAPVDLAQAAIGPGMAIYSKYAAVLEADGSPMPVHNALVMINKAIEDFLNPNGAGLDADTLFCSAWFDQLGWGTGKFGEADTLARAKGTSVDGVAHSGVVESGGGNVRLLRWDEYPRDWDPTQDNRTPVWEAIHQVIRALNQQGESAAGALLARMPERGDQIRQLAYHLYTLCERKKWADDARAYNELIAAWHGIVTASHETGHIDSQGSLDL
jgi:putative DNA methylase